MHSPADGAYQDVANAIIIKAVEDYRNALDGISYDRRLTPKQALERLEKFFHSKYYRTLTNVQADYLIEQLRKEHEEKRRKERLETMKVTLIQATRNPIKTIAKIASICYDSDPKNHLGLVKHLYENGHHSVFEHIYFTFKIEGISRACSHQLVRHRHCSFTQRSQRYCSEDGFCVVEPKSIEQIDEKDGFIHFMDNVQEHYAELQARGIPNEDARYLLPNACTTELYLSCNLRELIHIANERLCARAQWEIRELVKEMVSLVDPDLQFMLVPKCKSGRIICNSPCGVSK